MGSQDPSYHSLFVHESWRELIEKAEPVRADAIEIVSRIAKYLSADGAELVGLPVAEAMVTYKEKRLVC